jgi:hypothetical protein
MLELAPQCWLPPDLPQQHSSVTAPADLVLSVVGSAVTPTGLLAIFVLQAALHNSERQLVRGFS